MANQEHLEILKQGVKGWNRWEKILLHTPMASPLVISCRFLRLQPGWQMR